MLTDALSTRSVGVSGVLFGFRRGRGHQNPRRFFSGTARRHHLFLKKRWWGRPSPAWKAGSLVCGPWPHSSSPPVAGTPRCARNCSHQASGARDTIPPPAVRAPPFTQGRLIRCGFAADLSGPLCGKKKCGRGPQRKTPDAQRLGWWSGQRESNPPIKLGKLAFYR